MNTKFLNLIVESHPADADLTFDSIAFVHNGLPGTLDDALLYGFVTAYCQMLRCYDASCGVTKDRAHWPSGDFDSVPGIGLQILAAAAARDLNVISQQTAEAIALASADQLLAIPKETHFQGVGTKRLPHFARQSTGCGRERHPRSEWSSVDTAIACLSAYQGLRAPNLDATADMIFQQIVQQIDFSLFTIGGYLSHRIDQDGQLIPYLWDNWGGQLSVLEIIRAMKDPNLARALACRTCEHPGGVGFIIEMAALFMPEFAAGPGVIDQDGNDWHSRRVAHMNTQIGNGSGPLFGRSAGELLRYEDASTGYLVGGTGSSSPSIPLLCRSTV